jgi:hypothetical protein
MPSERLTVGASSRYAGCPSKGLAVPNGGKGQRAYKLEDGGECRLLAAMRRFSTLREDRKGHVLEERDGPVL